MKVLVTGANGQLGSELRELALPEEMTFTDVAELDLLDYQAVSDLFEEKGFDLVLNCAAYTAVDKAESEEELAQKINGDATKNLADLCKAHDCKLVHVSTDYVFDGTASTPYKETDEVNPKSAYGRTKLSGETAILESGCESMIIRTAWLYSTFGANIVKTVLKYSAERDQLGFVFDQVGSPTYAADLAQAIAVVVNDPSKFKTGVYHYANEGVTSWYDFALAVIELSGNSCHVNPIETYEYPVPAPRPAYSVFNKKKIKETLEISIPHWRESLKTCLTKLNS